MGVTVNTKRRKTPAFAGVFCFLSGRSPLVEAVVVMAVIRGGAMSANLTVSDAARELSDELGHVVRPRDISDLFYRRLLEDRHCPILGGRRLIPRDYLPAIVVALQGRGLIKDAPRE
jgi:hypothetical protein